MIEIDSKTDELRRLLDERGVEHGDVESAPYPPYNSTRRMTTFWANKCVWQYIEDEREGGDIELVGRYMSMSVTPEQAIATTLGRGECHDKNGFDPELGFECTVCGAMVDTYMVTPMEMGYVRQFAYCPFCGRKVVDEC